MALEITEARLLAFVCIVVMLTMYSIMDLRERRVSNEIMIVGFILGLVLEGLVILQLEDSYSFCRTIFSHHQPPGFFPQAV